MPTNINISMYLLFTHWHTKYDKPNYNNLTSESHEQATKQPQCV